VVRCTKCGAENKEDARYCVQCGASLYISSAREEKHEKHEKYEKHEKTEADVCFGPLLSVRYFWLIVGLLIVFWGISQLVEILFAVTFPIWPFFLIILGLYMIYRVLSRRRP
jgi:uncharacterized membrane protein YvbJ